MVRRYRPARQIAGLLAVAVVGAALTGVLVASKPDAETRPGAHLSVERDRDALRERLARVRAFSVTLSARPDTTRAVDLAIVDPDVATAEDVGALRRSGAVVLAYVNVGEREDFRKHAAQVDPAWIVAENPRWPGHAVVDVRESGWRDLVVRTVTPRALASGADGLFLDMLDAVSVVPGSESSMVALVRALREAQPDAAVVVNRGLAILNEIQPDVDGLLVESVWEGERGAIPEAESDSLAAALVRWRERTGLAALALDYPRDADAMARASREASRHRLPILLAHPRLDGRPVAP